MEKDAGETTSISSGFGSVSNTSVFFYMNTARCQSWKVASGSGSRDTILGVLIRHWITKKTPQQFYQEGLCNITPQENPSISLSQKNPRVPKVLVPPLQVLEASSLRSKKLSNLALLNQNLA